MWKTDRYTIQQHWKAVLLVLASGLLAVNEAAEHVAAASFANHTRVIAEAGGGVLFVFQPADCVATAETVTAAAQIIQSRGFIMKGLVIRAGVTADAMRTIVQAASLRFPHEPIAIGTAKRVVDLTGTPVALAVTSDGRIVSVEHITGEDAGKSLGTRLLHALTRSRTMS